MVSILLLSACLERTTGEFVPLDARYTAGHDDPNGEAGADPNAGGTGDAAYHGYKGETVKVTGVVESSAPGAVQIDVNEPDPGAGGGQKRVGQIPLPEPGPFELDVPASLEKLYLQAFQDPQVDGPSEDDPFAMVEVAIGGRQPEPLTIVLVKGARGKATGGPTPTGGGGPGDQPGAVFPDGPRVTLSGTVTASLPGPISIDFHQHTPDAPGGRTYLFKIQAESGKPWEQPFPEGYGPIEIEAYQDAKGDGPTPGDPRAPYKGNPLTVAGEDLPGLDIVLP